MHDPDADIIELVVRGERDRALRRLMQRYGDAIYRSCGAALRDDARADDVRQQVFIQAHRDLPRFDARATLRAWLFAVARNRVVDEVRRDTRWRRVKLEPEDIAPADDLDRGLDDARWRDALWTALGQLPDEVREAVLLRYQQGLSYTEMAVICGEKAATLQARVVRALAKLRTLVLRAHRRPRQRPRAPTSDKNDDRWSFSEVSLRLPH